jgi:hypothetical protein
LPADVVQSDRTSRITFNNLLPRQTGCSDRNYIVSAYSADSYVFYRPLYFNSSISLTIEFCAVEKWMAPPNDEKQETSSSYSIHRYNSKLFGPKQPLPVYTLKNSDTDFNDHWIILVVSTADGSLRIVSMYLSVCTVQDDFSWPTAAFLL